MLERRRQITTE